MGDKTVRGISPISGSSSVWLERVIWDHEAGGSSPFYRTIKDTYSNPSIRRLWVQIPWKAPLAFLAEWFTRLTENQNILCCVLLILGIGVMVARRTLTPGL